MLKRLRAYFALCLFCGTGAKLIAEVGPLDPAVPKSQQTQGDKPLTDNFWLMPQVSVVMPTELKLSNRDFKIPYSKQFANISQFALGAVTPLRRKGDFQLLAVGKLGLSFKQGTYGFERTSGDPVQGKLQLFWLPISVGGKVQYEIPGFPYIKPSFSMGGSLNWFYQTGSLGGLNSSYWIPTYFISPAVSFLEGQSSSDWFGGFTFGVSYQNSFSTQQSFKAWSFDLSINVLL